MSTDFNDTMDAAVESHERIKKSKRSKIVLIVIIVLLLLALGGLVYFGYMVFKQGADGAAAGITPGDDLSVTEVTDVSAPGQIQIETTSIPNLTSLFGLTVEEVSAKLGSQFQLKSSTPTTDNTNTAITQLATFSYVPVVTSGSEATSTATLPTESIYASLNESGKVVDVYYSCDMRLLGYQEVSFNSLLSSDSIVMQALGSAGITPRDFTFAPPGEGSIVYDNKDSANRKVIKQTQIYSGRASSEGNPTAWTLTVTYDFGVKGVASAEDFRQATRTIHLKLA
ncbi:MAG TPA: hypothetical protein DEB24_00105 [Coriobacteriia bacterium]|nr:hypothetical protein [Coriobacteriia bacterium]